MRRIHKNPLSPINTNKAKKSLKIIKSKVLAGTLNSKDFKKSIYGSDAVKLQLLKDQHYKCAYCEKKITDLTNDVEHFRPKTKCQQKKVNATAFIGYWWLAYTWENLLYSCSVCNRSYKKDIFPLEKPLQSNPTAKSVKTEKPLLINPVLEDPAKYIVFNQNEILSKNKSRKGTRTISVLGLDRADLQDDLRLNRWNDFCLILDALNEVDPSNPKYALLKQKVTDRFFSDASEYVGMFENQLSPIIL